MNWIESLVGADNVQTAGLFVFVFGLIIVAMLCWTIFSRFSQPRAGTGKRSQKARLAVTDAASVDSRRRLVLVRRDNVEHLIMIGGPLDLVIESEIAQDARSIEIGEMSAPVTPLPATSAEALKKDIKAELSETKTEKPETKVPGKAEEPKPVTRAESRMDADRREASPVMDPRKPSSVIGGEDRPVFGKATPRETGPAEVSAKPAPVPATPSAPSSPISPSRPASTEPKPLSVDTKPVAPTSQPVVPPIRTNGISPQAHNGSVASSTDTATPNSLNSPVLKSVQPKLD